MTDNQRTRLMGYWWPDACAAAGWPKSDRDFRIAKFSEWIGRRITSANELSNEDIDEIKSRCLALSQPSSLQAQEAQVNMPRTRLVWRLQQLARQLSPAYVATAPFGSPYVAAIMRDRWGHYDPDRLSAAELKDLRNTLQARVAAKRRREKQTAEVPAAAADDANPF